MKTHTLTFFLLLFFANGNSQNKNDWFLIGETGMNKVNGNNKLHLGIGAEYFISSTRSFMVRLKYFETGIDCFSEGYSSRTGFFSVPSRRLLYEGSVLKIPVSYKWEKRFISPKLKFLFTTGLAINFTLKDEFIEKDGVIPFTNDEYLDINLGFGFLYKMNTNLHIFILGETHSGTAKTEEINSFLFSSRLRTEESLFNFGIRYRLQKLRITN